MTINVRNELPEDICKIEMVTAAAFKEAPQTSHSEQFIVNALRESKALTISLVAEDAGELIGHVAISPVTISDGSNNWYGLGPISVMPQRQGQGVGTLLMNKALDALREEGAEGCVLLGDPNYYRRFGFNLDERLVLPEVPPEYFQIVSFTGQVPQGNVTFHYAFNMNE